ncbi:MAG: amidase [Solirubrobacteraceae bacterium]|nr:amidase [Solirubrobacteraceae bacterium]
MPESPSLDDLRRLAASQRLHLSDAQLAEFGVLIDETLGDSYARLDELAAPAPGAPGPRDPGVRPGADEDPLGAWYRRCEIREREDGPLAGLRVAVKDNINVAGVPMMNGSRMVEGYTPAFDATVITRILAAGGTIAGKAVCEHLCFSGGSHTSDTGPVRNPHDPARNAGGSSSGSAALVASGAVELALGGDQGGSIRVPASYCGCYGLKPTFGLVPYTGAAPIERTLDHLGPMAASPHGLALLLSVIAGPDGLDPRQGGVEPGDYLGGLGGGVGGLRIGIVREGFGWEQSEAPVDEAVRTTIARLAEGGAVVEELSIPRHRDGLHVWTGIAVEGAFNTVVRGNSGGTNAAGVFDTALIDHITAAREADPDAFSATVKFTALLGEWLQTRYGGRYYAHARTRST